MRGFNKYDYKHTKLQIIILIWTISSLVSTISVLQKKVAVLKLLESANKTQSTLHSIVLWQQKSVFTLSVFKLQKNYSKKYHASKFCKEPPSPKNESKPCRFGLSLQTSIYTQASITLHSSYGLQLHSSPACAMHTPQASLHNCFIVTY